MAKHDIDLCHHPQKTSFVMLNKHIYESEAEAKRVLIERHLGPGEMAAVRYGEDDGFGSYKNVGMILGIGGAAFGGQDTYFFTGDKVVDTDLSNYYNKSEIDKLFAEINNKFESYYTKGEIDNLIENIDFDYDLFYTKDEINTKIENIDNSINNITNEFSTFETTLNEINENVTNIENTYVSNDTFNEYKNVIENTYVTNETLVTEVTQIIVDDPSTGEAISEQVTIAVDEKVAELVEDNKIITSDNVTTIVVQEVEKAIKEQGDYDGGNEEDWPSPDEIESTDTPATPGEDGGEEESWE